MLRLIRVGLILALLAVPTGVALAGATASEQGLPQQLAALAARMVALEAANGQLQAQVWQQNEQISGLQSTVSAQIGLIGTLRTSLATLQASVAAQATDLGAVKNSSVMALAPYLSVNTASHLVKFTGVNLQLVKDEALWDSDEVRPNGLGNLLIGYNQPMEHFLPYSFTCSIGAYTDAQACTDHAGVWQVSHKGGSHYLVVGEGHNYSQKGGVVFGRANTASMPFASVLGGQFNTARESYAIVVNAYRSIASGAYATVTGGGWNMAAGWGANVSGGTSNAASGHAASVSGGQENTVAGDLASVHGGYQNHAAGRFATVSGGASNEASGISSLVSGGDQNHALHSGTSILGGGPHWTTTNGQTIWLAY